jgi:hypothetical protein
MYAYRLHQAGVITTNTAARRRRVRAARRRTSAVRARIAATCATDALARSGGSTDREQEA